jgi:hypothetical protein
MRFFIKEWPNKTATLLAENGTVLWTFSNAQEAEKVAKDWCRVQGENHVYHLDSLSPSDPVPTHSIDNAA